MPRMSAQTSNSSRHNMAASILLYYRRRAPRTTKHIPRAIYKLCLPPSCLGRHERSCEHTKQSTYVCRALSSGEWQQQIDRARGLHSLRLQAREGPAPRL